MNVTVQPVSAQRTEWLPSLFASLFGAFLGLALLKFGNPPITEKYVTSPTNLYEVLFGYPWPIGWAYKLLAVVTLVGIVVAGRRRAALVWLLNLPLAWMLWEYIAGTRSVDPTLTDLTLKHFAACVVCFYLGYFSLSRSGRLWPFWAGLFAGLVLVLATGWEQRFGGLEESRRYFFTYVYPQMKEVPPEYLKKISSNRIFGTLFYPNTLAGALLLLLPALLAALWQMRALLTAAARAFLIGVVGTAGLACLYWSGSKAGWLLMLLLGLVALLRVPISRRLKVALVTAVLVAGLAGFFVKYAAFFEKGATSVSARFDYWHAAVHTAMEKPAFGSGPGTFAIAYQRVKRPESEMSRLAHNDYLEQASDSGWPGFLLYTAFIIGALVWSFPRQGVAAVRQSAADVPDPEQPRSAEPQLRVSETEDSLPFAVWLGVLGWSLQGMVEFGLYIPALSWPAFAFLGRLLAQTPNPRLAPAPPPPAKL